MYNGLVKGLHKISTAPPPSHIDTTHSHTTPSHMHAQNIDTCTHTYPYTLTNNYADGRTDGQAEAKTDIESQI